MNKKLVIVFAIFTVIGLGLFYFLTMGNVGTKYNTIKVSKNEAGAYVQDTGVISSENIRQYYTSGSQKIKTLDVALGDAVEKGQLIMTYDNTLELEIQKVKKQVEALEATYNDALSGTDMESVNSARIEVYKIKSQLDMAVKKQERTKILYENGAESQTNLDDAVHDVDQLQSSLNVAKNTYNQLAKNLSENKRKKYEADIDVLLLDLKILEAQQDDYWVYADVDGIVTELNTFEGDTPAPGILMLEIQDPSSKIVVVDFMVEDAINIEEGMGAEISDLKLNTFMENLSVEKVHPKAFVTLSELSVEENRQSVEIGLPSDMHALPFGLEVETKVWLDEVHEMIMVPIGTVIYKNDKTYVKLLEGEKLVDREVKTGIKVDDKIEVEEGLELGDEILVNYQD